jgi:large subunit ribosomal protein L31e
MANIERTYTIPLRREWLKSVKYKRAKKAVRAIKEFLMRHMKADAENVKIGRYLNLIVWAHGIKNPPSRVKVNVTKDDKGVVHAEMVGAPVEKKKEEKPKKGEKKAEPAKAAAPKPAEVKPAAPKPAVPKAPAQPAPKQPSAPKQQAQIIR